MWLYYVRRYKHVIWGAILAGVLICITVLGIRLNDEKKDEVDKEMYSGKTMGTAVKKSLYMDDKTERDKINVVIDQQLRELENQISVRVVDSEVAKCNRSYVKNGLYSLSPNIIEYLRLEMQISDETDGAFSPCIRPVTALWKIEEGQEEIPSAEDVQKQLKSIDRTKLSVLDDGVIFGMDTMAIDFGAVGKGIACDEVLKILEESSVDSAVVAVGGSVVTYGTKADGKKWNVGIRDPRGDVDDTMGVIYCGEKEFISTSGDYEKYFEVDDKRYHHIMDPATGYPVDNELMSVTIVGDSGILSDALSTACFVLGLDKGMEYAQKKNVGAVFVTKDKKVTITPDLKKRFYIKNHDYKMAK